MEAVDLAELCRRLDERGGSRRAVYAQEFYTNDASVVLVKIFHKMWLHPGLD